MPHDSTLGAAFIGGFLAAILYGVMTLQSYSFFQKYPREGIVLKFTIRGLWLLHTLHLAFITQGIYEILISNFGNIAATTTSPWGISAGSFVNAWMALLVDCSYCYRIWKLSSRSHAITIPLLCLTFAAFGFGVASDIKLLLEPSFTAYKSTEWLLFVSLVSMCSVDLYIAIWLCLWLRRQGQGLSDQTHSMINTIVVYTVATDLITSIFAIAELIAGAILPNTYIFIGIDFFRNGVRSNSLMASLNARDRFRRDIRSGATVVTSVRFARDAITETATANSVPGAVEQSGVREELICKKMGI